MGSIPHSWITENFVVYFPELLREADQMKHKRRTGVDKKNKPFRRLSSVIYCGVVTFPS